MNAMIYIRGNHLDFYYWASLGNQGWSFNDVLPYFKKSQMQTRGESEFHGASGPLHVTDLRSVNPLDTCIPGSGRTPLSGICW